ncbi:MAG: mechanosensitive ion channel family protein [Myxococcota bacterium]
MPGENVGEKAVGKTTEMAGQSADKLLEFQDVLTGYANDFIQVLPSIAIAIVILVIFWILAKVGKRLAVRAASRFTDDKSLKGLFGTVANVLITLIGVFAAMASVFPGLQAGDLVAVLGLSSVAIGFAFKDIFQNFLAGVLILTSRPFRIEDQIEAEGLEGTVEDISIRNTIIKTYDGQSIIVPNSILFTNPVTVRTDAKTRRTTFTTGIGYDEDIEEARQVMIDALEGCDEVLDDPAPQVFVASHGDSSVNFDIRYWTKSVSGNVRRGLDQVATSVKYALDDAGIEIPYPVRTVEFFDKSENSEDAA